MAILRSARRTETRRLGNGWLGLGALILGAVSLAGCAGTASSVAAAGETFHPQPAPPASQTGGFDGTRAWGYLKTIVDFGPRPPGTPNIRRERAYLVKKLGSFGCAVSQDHFHAQTDIGNLALDNIDAKIPGQNPDIVLLLSHYDTLRLPGFVGADDGGSSTALLLEVAHDMCGKPSPMTIRIAFVDGEEDQTNFTNQQQAQSVWSDSNAEFGSRELAARMENSGELKKVKAVLLADMIGDANLEITRDSNSTPWLEHLIWKTADHLDYGRYFLPSSMSVDDDHMPFIQKGVAAADVIDFNYPYWHTDRDTLDKCSPHSLAVIGHVFLATIQALDRKFAPKPKSKKS